MQLRVSNLAWDDAGLFYGLLRSEGIDCAELAPTKIWPTLEAVTEEVCREYLASEALLGVKPVAFQALLFGCSQLQFFQAPKECLERLEVVMRVAQWLGVRILVFGSPKNRLLSGGSTREASTVLHVLSRAGDLARRHGCLFCIEPNPPMYGGNWAQGLADTAAVLRELNHPGVRLHADTGAMLANGESVEQLEAAFDLLVSAHVSLPGLKALTLATVLERALIRDALLALGRAPHLHSVGLEMTRAEDLDALTACVRLFKELAA